MAHGSVDADVAVIGAGCIGASTAKHLAEMGHRVTVYEKEAEPAMHQSGRNSGVIHAGYNLKPGSEKARFCVEGSRRMRAYCRERDVPVEEGGILVVASREEQLPSLDTLHRYGTANGVQVHRIHGERIPDIEPHATGLAAIHAPEGASVDAAAYVRSLVADAQAAGATFHWGTKVAGIDHLKERVVVNAAGLHADVLAKDLCPDMRIIPFRGSYATVLSPGAGLVRSHIYAAPDPDFPFLGVHLSRRTGGSVMAGPGAMLAFGREAYHSLSVRPDVGRTLGWPGFWRLWGHKSFRRQVRSEIGKSLSVRSIWKEARALVPELARRDVRRGSSEQAGNRAQMVDRAGNLVDDIVVRETERAVHVLNAVSPGLTCSLPFGEHLAERAAGKL